MKETSSKCPQKALKGPHLNEHVHFIDRAQNDPPTPYGLITYYPQSLITSLRDPLPPDNKDPFFIS